MQTSDEMTNDLQAIERPTKRVKFSEDTKDNPVFTPLARPHSSSLRRLWFNRCQNGAYEQLKIDLNLYQQRGLTLGSFFSKEGRVLLDSALIFSPEIEELGFICENIPKNLIQKELVLDNYSILDAFLLGETGLENHKKISKKELENRCEKIKLLLAIGSSDVKEFLENSLSRNDIGTGIKDSIKKVLSEFNLGKSLLISE